MIQSLEHSGSEGEDKDSGRVGENSRAGVHKCVCDRDERDFGLETETETRGVSRPVSSFETTCQKSQYESQNLRLIPKVSVSVSKLSVNFYP